MGGVGGIGSVHSLPRSTSKDSLNLNTTEKKFLNKFKAFNSANFSTFQKSGIKKEDVHNHLKALDSSNDWSPVNNFEGNLSSLREDYQAASLNKFQDIENPSETLLKNTAKDLADRLEAKIEKNKKFSVYNSVRQNTIKRLTKRLHNIEFLLKDFLNNSENQIIGTIGWGEHCSIQLEKKAGVSQLDGVIVKEGEFIKYYQLSTSIDVFGRRSSSEDNLIKQKVLYTIGDDDSSSVISASSDDVQSEVSEEDNRGLAIESHEDLPSSPHKGAALGNVGSTVSADLGFNNGGKFEDLNLFGINLGSNSLVAELEKFLFPSSVEGSQVSSSGDSRTSHSSSDSAGSSGSASLTDTSQTSPLSDPKIESPSNVQEQAGELNEQKQEEGGVLDLVDKLATQVSSLGGLAKGLFESDQAKGSSDDKELQIPSGESLANNINELRMPGSISHLSSPRPSSSPKSPNSQDERLGLGGINVDFPDSPPSPLISPRQESVGLDGVNLSLSAFIDGANRLGSNVLGSLEGLSNSLSSTTSEEGPGRLGKPDTPPQKPPQTNFASPPSPPSPPRQDSRIDLGGVGESAVKLLDTTGLGHLFNSPESSPNRFEQESTSASLGSMVDSLAGNLTESLGGVGSYVKGLLASDTTPPQTPQSKPTFSEHQDSSLDEISFMEKITMQDTTKQKISEFISNYKFSSSPNTYPSSKQASAVEAYIRGNNAINIQGNKQAVQKMIIHKARADETLKQQLLEESRQGQSAGLSSEVKPFVSLMSMLDEDAQKVVRYELSISELPNQGIDQEVGQPETFQKLTKDLKAKLTNIGRGQDSNSESVTDCFKRLATVVKFEEGGQYYERLNDVSKINDSALKELLKRYRITPQQPKDKVLQKPWKNMSDDEKIQLCKPKLVANLNSKIKRDVASVTPLVTAIKSSADLQKELLNQLGMKEKSENMQNFLKKFPSQAQQEGHDKISENFKNTLQQLKTVSKIEEIPKFEMLDSQKSDLKSRNINLKIESTIQKQAEKIKIIKNEIEKLFSIDSNDVDELIKEFTINYHSSKANLPSFLNRLFPNNTEAQKNFVANYLYPLVATQIQGNVLQSGGNSGYVANPASSKMIRQLIDDHDIDKALDFIGQSYWGFNAQGNSGSPAMSTLLSNSQLSAVLGMCKVANDGRSQTIKLKAGEGKTYLSKIAPKLFPETFNFPIIHIAPFAQDDIGEELTERNFNSLNNGKHYWIKAETLQLLLDQDNGQKMGILKKSYIFCDEYDRYLPLTKKLNNSGITRQCLMSATDDLKILEKRYANTYSRLDSLVNRDFLKSFPDWLGIGYSDINTAKNSSEEFKDYLDTLKPKEDQPTLSQKLSSLTNKLRGYVDRYVDQVQHEFTRDMSFKPFRGNSGNSLSDFLPSKDELTSSEWAKQELKKLQIIIPSLEIVGQEGEIQQDGIIEKSPKTIASEIKQWKASVGLQDSVFVHFLAPKDMENFKEGSSVVCKITDGQHSFISLDEVNKDSGSNTGVHLCVYDRFNKVGGDFGKWSEGVDYQALDTLIPESDGDLSESLLYQLSCRNRPGSSGKKCELTMFSTNTLIDKDMFLQNLKEKESKLTAQRIKEQTLAKCNQKRKEFLKIAIYDFLHSIPDEDIKNKMKVIIGARSVHTFESSVTKKDVSEIISDEFLYKYFSEDKHYTINDVAEKLNEEYLKLIKSQYFEQDLLGNMAVKTIADAVKAIVSPVDVQRTKFENIRQEGNGAGKQVYDTLKQLGFSEKGIEEIKKFDQFGNKNIRDHIDAVLIDLGNPKKLAIKPSSLLQKAQTRYDYYKRQLN
jgi:hypothetical protein